MIRILNKIFESLKFDYNEFKINSNQNSEDERDEKDLYTFEFLGKSIFYYFCDFKLVYSNNVNELNNKIIESQKEIYNLIMNNKNYNLIKKNSIYLIAIEVNEENEDDIKKLVLQLEEDKYYFRKLIITYNKDQLDSLYEKVNDIKDILVFINETIRDINLFQKFKIENNDDFYKLLMKLMIKIPILNFQIEKSKEIKNLENIILEDINKSSDLKILTEKIMDFDINQDEKNIDLFIDLLLVEEEEINE